MALFGGVDFSLDRLMRAAKVVPHNGEWVLAFEENVAFNVADMYALRARLHRRVYQHRAVMVVEGLLRDLIRAVDDASGGVIRRCLDDVDAFVDLGGDDGVFHLAAQLRSHAEVAGAMDALLERPWFSRVPLTACIRSHRAPRAVPARPSRMRTARAAARALLHASPSSSQTACSSQDADFEGTATFELCRMLERDDVRVHIVDVHLGTAVATEDPHGRVWRDYDPLRKVIFVRNGTSSRVNSTSPHFHVPSVRHVRTVHCYLPAGASAEELRRAEDAFRVWTRGCGSTIEGDHPHFFRASTSRGCDACD